MLRVYVYSMPIFLQCRNSPSDIKRKCQYLYVVLVCLNVWYKFYNKYETCYACLRMNDRCLYWFHVYCVKFLFFFSYRSWQIIFFFSSYVFTLVYMFLWYCARKTSIPFLLVFFNVYLLLMFCFIIIYELSLICWEATKSNSKYEHWCKKMYAYRIRWNNDYVHHQLCKLFLI
jgi:hypothetical protein